MELTERWRLTDRACDEHTRQVWNVRRASAAASETAQAILYTGDADANDFEYFARHMAILTHQPSGFATLVDGSLDARQPWFVCKKLDCVALDQWLRNCAALPPRPTLLWILRKVVSAVRQLHRLGYVHGNISPQAIQIADSRHVLLEGLEACEPVGAAVTMTRQPTIFDPPEMCQGELLEASSAQDTFAVGVLGVQLLGKTFGESKVGKLLLHPDCERRPTSHELLPLLLELELALFGQYLADDNVIAA